MQTPHRPTLLRCCALLLACTCGQGAFLAALVRAEGLSPADAVRAFQVPEGFAVKLFASEPEIRQPVSMTFDRRGRMWVIQYLQYPHPNGLKVVKVDNYLRTVYDRVPEPPPKGPRGVDRITILEDTDGDGRADGAKDFLTGLNLTTGMALGHGGVFVLQSPYLLFYADRNHDDVPDGDPEVLLSGFGMEDSHAFANSLQWGPDGWLYGAQGSTVTAHIRGLTFQQGIWRYHPVSKRFELFAEGGGNTWGLDFDRHGNIMAGTNYGGHAMLHQVQGGYYVKNFGKHGELQNPFAFGYFEHVPHPDFKGGHVTIGGIVYQADAFPAQYRDQYLAANVLSNAIYWHHIERDGSSFKNRFGGDLMTTDDKWFRPVDCTVGPDGSLFIADWYDQRANHVDPKDDWDKTNGRIFKLEYQGTKPVVGLDLDKLGREELVAMLAHRNEWYVRQARCLLVERHEKLGSVATWLAKPLPSPLDLETFWTCTATDTDAFVEDEAAVRAALGHANEDVRAWAVRLLGDAVAPPALVAELPALAAKEPSPTVRSQLACTAKRLPSRLALPIVAALWARSEDASDPHIPLLLWWAIEDKAASDRAGVLGLLGEPRTWALPIVRDAIVERLARRYAAAGTDDDFDSCSQLLALAPAPADVDRLVAGMEKGLEGRQLASVPGPLAERFEQLWSSRQPPDTRLVRLAIRLGKPAGRQYALARLADRKAPSADRLAMIDIEGQLGGEECVPALLALVDAKEPAAVRKAAILALQRFQLPEIGARVLDTLPQATSDVRAAALTLLCSRPAWAALLIDAVDAGRVPPADVTADYLQKIALLNQPALNKRMEKHWGKVVQSTPAEKLAQIHGIRVSLKLAAGDPDRGKVLFMKHCGICHTLFGEGNKIGPELTGADRKNQIFLLSNIVDPSAVIRKEFFQYTAVLNDGRVLSGLIAESTPNSVTLLDAKNQRTVIAQSDIDTLEPSTQSLMPEKILDPLSAQEVRDLMSYLQK